LDKLEEAECRCRWLRAGICICEKRLALTLEECQTRYMLRQQPNSKENTAYNRGMIHCATATAVESRRKTIIREWCAW
jgi:hypothetical protein